jgi:hypothetical protein
MRTELIKIGRNLDSKFKFIFKKPNDSVNEYGIQEKSSYGLYSEPDMLDLR